MVLEGYLCLYCACGFLYNDASKFTLTDPIAIYREAACTVLLFIVMSMPVLILCFIVYIRYII